MSDAAFIVAQGNIISLIFHMFIGVAHNHANLGELQHLKIVRTVSAGQQILSRKPEFIEQKPSVSIRRN